jgi:hypothetical protein
MFSESWLTMSSVFLALSLTDLNESAGILLEAAMLLVNH